LNSFIVLTAFFIMNPTINRKPAPEKRETPGERWPRRPPSRLVVAGAPVDKGELVQVPVFPYGDKEIAHLKERDPILGEAIDRIGRIEREVIPELFPGLIHTILAQQISSQAVKTVWQRFREVFPEMTPPVLAAADMETIQRCGTSFRKAGYIKGVAEAVLAGKLDLRRLPLMPDEEVVKHLCALKGLGLWSAEMFLIFSLLRPDVVSWGDLAIRKGMMALYNLPELDRDTFEKYRRLYSPYGTVASLYLWEIAAGR